MTQRLTGNPELGGSQFQEGEGEAGLKPDSGGGWIGGGEPRLGERWDFRANWE